MNKWPFYLNCQYLHFIISPTQGGEHMDVLLSAKDKKSTQMFPNAIGFLATAKDRTPEVALFHAQATYVLRPFIPARDAQRHVHDPGKVQWAAVDYSPACVAHFLVWRRVDQSSLP